MRKIAVFAVLVVLVSGLAFGAVGAQDAMTEKIVCDSDLILSLLSAEYNFGFAAVYDQMMMAESGDAMGMALDLAAFEKGQFAPLFDGMMAMMDESMAMPNSMMSEEMMTSVVEAMGMDMAELDSMMMAPEGMTTLVPPVIADEPAECTALRDELRHFYTALAYTTSTMMMAEGQ